MRERSPRRLSTQGVLQVRNLMLYVTVLHCFPFYLGWNKVDKLAKLILATEGLSITNREASAITECYDNLEEYDKRPLKYHQVIRKPRGRFGRSKSSRSGHVGLTAMKRYLPFLCTIIWVLSTTFLRCFLSAGFPASSPSKSRVVEAICLRLCDSISGPSRATRSAGPSGSSRREFRSRWNRILTEYNTVRARVMGSSAVTESTSISLYPLNKHTLIKWYQNTERAKEVMLRNYYVNTFASTHFSFFR